MPQFYHTPVYAGNIYTNGERTGVSQINEFRMRFRQELLRMLHNHTTGPANSSRTLKLPIDDKDATYPTTRQAKVRHRAARPPGLSSYHSITNIGISHLSVQSLTTRKLATNPCCTDHKRQRLRPTAGSRNSPASVRHNTDSLHCRGRPCPMSIARLPARFL